MNWLGVLAILSMIIFSVYGLFRGKVSTVEDYVVAEHSVGHVMLWGTMIATWCSAMTLFSPAEFAFSNGVQGFIWHIYINLGLWAAVPVVLAMKKVLPKGMTLPHYIGERFNLPSRILASFCVIVFGLVECSTIVFLGATTMNVLGGVPFVIGGLVIAITFAIYTSVGGLRAVAKTDTLRLLLFVWIALVVIPVTIIKAGGTNVIYKALSWDPDAYTLIRITPFAMITYLLAHTAAVAYGPLWQRSFAARSSSPVKKLVPAWYFGWLPFALSGAVLGIIAKAHLYNQINSPSEAVAATIMNFTPGWAQAIFVVGFFAILISTADSNVNTAVSVWCIDIYRNIKPDATDESVLKSGRVLSIIMCAIVTIVGLFFVQGALKFLLYMWNSLSALVLPIILGLFWKRITGWGAFWGMFIGSLTTSYMIIAGYSEAPLAGFYSMAIPMLVSALITIGLSFAMPEEKGKEHLVVTPASKGIAPSPVWWLFGAYVVIFTIFPFLSKMITPALKISQGVFNIFMWIPLVGGITLLITFYWGYLLDRKEEEEMGFTKIAKDSVKG